MAYHTNLRRAYVDFRRAVYMAWCYGLQTGWKHRVRRAGTVWRIEKTDRPFRYSA